MIKKKAVQHTRKTKTGKTVIVNKGVAKTTAAKKDSGKEYSLHKKNIKVDYTDNYQYPGASTKYKGSGIHAEHRPTAGGTSSTRQFKKRSSANAKSRDEVRWGKKKVYKGKSKIAILKGILKSNDK